MSTPRLLLVTGLPPDPRYPSGAFLRDLCDLYPPTHLSICLLGKLDYAAIPGVVNAFAIDVPREQGISRFGRRAAQIARWPHDMLLRRAADRIVQQVAAIARKTKADLIWLPVIGPLSYLIAAPLAKKHAIPLITMVWDPPEYMLGDHYVGVKGRRLQFYMRAFGEGLRASTRCAVVSEGMRRAYESEYGVDCTVICHGIHSDLWRTCGSTGAARGELVIGYAGSVYAFDQWRALVEALHSVNWQMQGRRVVLKVYNRDLSFTPSVPVQIEVCGWRPMAEVISSLATMDACYLSYWSDEEHRSVVGKSFPTKLSTYVAAGTPVLYHGPVRSTPAEFIERYPVGVTCGSLRTSEILEAVATCTDPARRAESARAARLALQEQLGWHVMRSRFAEALGVGENSLRALAPSQAAV